MSPSGASYKISTSPDNRALQLRRVVIRGAPFKNPSTVKDLIVKCVPKLTVDDAERVVEKATSSPQMDATVIVCLENDAKQYCRNLIENGLESDIA